MAWIAAFSDLADNWKSLKSCCPKRLSWTNPRTRCSTEMKESPYSFLWPLALSINASRSRPSIEPLVSPITCNKTPLMWKQNSTILYLVQHGQTPTPPVCPFLATICFCWLSFHPTTPSIPHRVSCCSHTPKLPIQPYHWLCALDTNTTTTNPANP